MKFVLAAVAALGLALGAVVVSDTATARSNNGNGNSRSHWDRGDWMDWWNEIGRSCDGDCGAQNLVKVKREIAVKLCVAMARSGDYTDLNDNDFSDFCIKVASHLGDSAYDHTN